MEKRRVYITSGCLIKGKNKAEDGNYFTIQPEDFEPFISDLQLRGVDRVSKITIAAARQAVLERGLTISKSEPNDYNLMLGTTYGALDSIHSFDMVSVEKGALYVNPGLFPNTVLNSIACQVEIQLAIAGPVYTVCNGLTSSLDTIGLGYNYIQSGLTSLMLAGGVDEITNLQLLIHKGTAPLGEAAGFVVMESDEVPSCDNAKPLAEVVGYLSSSIENSMLCFVQQFKQFLDMFNLQEKDIGEFYFNSYYTGDVYKEVLETVFGSNKEFLRLDCDWMGANGVVQVITDINSNRGGNSGQVSIITNFDNDRISILALKK